MSLIGINQLPDSDTRGQHGSKICFAKFIYGTMTKWPITQQLIKLEKKIERILNP
jgi:hypothetical protein